MLVVCRLAAILREKGLSVKRLSKLSGASRDTITRLANNDFKRLQIDVIARLLAALGSISMDELFEVYDPSIFFPVRLHREVTFHLGSEAIAAERDTALDGSLARDSVRARAIRAMSSLQEEFPPDIRVHVRVHARHDAALGEAARLIFEQGNHIVLGSPLTNQLAEEVVCRAHKVPPYSPDRRREVPFAFKWGAERSVRSSFGFQATDGELGIVSTRTGELVAAHATVPEGQGETCALIEVYRVWRPPVRRRYGRHDENVIVVVLGYCDLGIEGAALALLDPTLSRELYPARSSTPLMRAVSVSYVRPPSPSPQDNRQIVSARLVAES